MNQTTCATRLTVLPGDNASHSPTIGADTFATLQRGLCDSSFSQTRAHVDCRRRVVR